MVLAAVGAFGASASGKAAALPALSTALTVGGFGLSAIGALRSGQAASLQAQQQAELFRRQAERERQLSEVEASEADRRNRALIGRQRLLQGVSGVTAEGTPISVAENTAAEAEFQRLKILSGGLADESKLLTQAGFSEFSGREALRSGRFRAGASVLKGAGQLFG